jgi:hypothetical protein
MQDFDAISPAQDNACGVAGDERAPEPAGQSHELINIAFFHQSEGFTRLGVTNERHTTILCDERSLLCSLNGWRLTPQSRRQRR